MGEKIRDALLLLVCSGALLTACGGKRDRVDPSAREQGRDAGSRAVAAQSPPDLRSTPGLIDTNAASTGGRMDRTAPAADSIAVRALVKAFNDEEVLGTAAAYSITGVKILGPRLAVATVGERFDDDAFDASAYTLRLVKERGEWSILYVDYVFEPTGTRTTDTLDPPFSLRTRRRYHDVE